MDPTAFREALLSVMERKVHPAWPAFESGRVPADRLHRHFEQEWETYVRDFPVLVGRVYVRCPVPAVRRDLAANLYEEETGGLAAGKPHPELFLEVPAALGMDMGRFENVRLLSRARRYRRFIDSVTKRGPWETGLAVVTIFIEGTPWERGELDSCAPRRPEPPLEEHPLVAHYGLPTDALALVRAHRAVEGRHRAAAWRSVLEHTAPENRDRVVAAMEEALRRWLDYRDGVAWASGLSVSNYSTHVARMSR